MKKQNAFTLAELLVSILIISVILTLLAPVITKRAKESISVSTSSLNSKLYIYNKSNPECSEISGVNNSIQCLFTVPSGVKRINAIAVSGGGGGAGATQPSIEYGKKLTVANATPKTSKTQELTITNGMSNVTVTELIGSGAGGGGAGWAQSEMNTSSNCNSTNADAYQAIYIPAQYNGGKAICVSKYNVGDEYGPTIQGGVKSLQGSQECDNWAAYYGCCWKGNTAGTCTAGNGDYSGCRRTMCTLEGAKRACSYWNINGSSGWRLPTVQELKAWSSHITEISVGLGNKGLQLCDAYPVSASPRCNASSANICKAEGMDGRCHPWSIWSSTETKAFSLSNGNFNQSYEYPVMGVSARCVLDADSQTLAALSGGGGGAGAYIKNYQIPNDVISSNIGGKIKLFSAAGGSGGSSASSSGSSASNGTSGLASYVEVYAPDGVTLVWGIRASGGNYGYRATSTAAGNGGAQTSANSCQLYENGVWKSINCTGVGIKGTNGNKVESASSTNTATGGSGGGSMYNSSTVIGGGSGGSISSANGYNGSVYGAGGGGATIVFDSSNNVTKGIGGNGANGVAEITYDLVYSAAAGGGGGGGAYVELSDISVSSGNTYTIKVGNGGSGGSISTKGSDGGESEIVFDSITYTLSGGKGGQIGTSATSTTNVIQGIGGSGGIVSSNVSDTTNIKYKNGSKGEDGGSFTKDDTHSNSTNYGGSYGGVGGVSGIDTKGSCSGLFIDSSICSNTTVNGITNTFVAPIINNTAIDYGQAGAGGGGGGWSENTILYPNPGSGSQGQGGYVFIYWRE